MKVLLKRNLFAGGVRYRMHSEGTEIPDEIAGKRVIPWEKDREWKADEMPLPRDAKILVEAAPPKFKGPPKPVALSELNKNTEMKGDASTLSELAKRTPDPLSKLK